MMTLYIKVYIAFIHLDANLGLQTFMKNNEFHVYVWYNNHYDPLLRNAHITVMH